MHTEGTLFREDLQGSEGSRRAQGETVRQGDGVRQSLILGEFLVHELYWETRAWPFVPHKLVISCGQGRGPCDFLAEAVPLSWGQFSWKWVKLGAGSNTQKQGEDVLTR